MSGPVKHKEIIKAWLDGATVQFKHAATGGWVTMIDPGATSAMPTFVAATEYRIKPQPVKVLTRRVAYQERNGSWTIITINKYYVDMHPHKTFDDYVYVRSFGRRYKVLDPSWVETEVPIDE